MPMRLDDLDPHCANGRMARRASQVAEALRRLAQVGEVTAMMEEAGREAGPARSAFEGCACCGIIC